MADNAVIQTHELTKTYFYQFLGSLRFLTGLESFKWLETQMISARALNDLTLDVRRGEVFGLLGPNGSGKSTAIKLILGLIFPTSGQVSVFGKRPQNVSIKKHIGFLAEESYLYRFLDAEETLDFYGRLFDLTPAEREKRINSLLDMVGLLRERRRSVSEFSKGMQRRIGIAQALINDPDLVILDEPTTGLDPLGTREVKDLILQLKAKGKTVLLSSHLLADVEDVCDRIAILYGGRVQAMGPVDDVLSRTDTTQITAPMDDQTREEVLALLRKRISDVSGIKVAPPRERLERFFLRVVEEAQSQRLDTSGVRGATGQLDFLTQAPAEEGNVLERLVRTDDEASAPVQTETVRKVETPTGTDRGMLDRLASGPGDDTPAATVEEEVEEVHPRSAETDRGLLDSLTRDADDEADDA